MYIFSSLRFLSYSIDPASGIRKQDAASSISIVASNVYGRDIAFDFVRERWNQIRE